MSSNSNLDVKVLLQYITRNFNNWGMEYMTEQILKKSKNNEPQACQHMIRLLFDLSILHIFNYEYFIDQINIQITQEEQINIILAHLFEINCPLIVVQNHQDQQNMIGFDFSSSKNLLITCGWIMAVSNFFNMTSEKLLKKKFQLIYQSKGLNLNIQKYKNIIPMDRENLYQQQDEMTRISILYKLFQRKKYRIQCLIAKKKKILQYLRKQLKSIDENLHLEDLLSQRNPEEIQQLEYELKEMISYEKLNMSNRKYWWLWLDQKIIVSEYIQLSNTYQSFEKLQQSPQLIKYSIDIDLDYVKRYYGAYNSYQDQLEEAKIKIESLELDFKKSYKEIQREIMDQIRHQSGQRESSEASMPSFIGLQLKQYLKIQQSKQIKQTKSSKKGIQKSRKKLGQSVKTFIKQIEEIVFI